MMTAIDAQVGMSLPGVWARYHRARPAKRPDRFRTAPIRITPWQKMLAGALNEHDAICVRATVITPPWSEADRAQITAARRAAHRLVAADLARTVHVQVRAGDMLREVNHLVLVRSERYGVA
jgi:hypothetical protein